MRLIRVSGVSGGMNELWWSPVKTAGQSVRIIEIGVADVVSGVPVAGSSGRSDFPCFSFFDSQVQLSAHQGVFFCARSYGIESSHRI